MFELHPQLQKDTVVVGYFDLCVVLLHKDSQYPWCILVPQRADIREIFELSAPERALLMEESCRLSLAIQKAFEPEKLNVASLGNVVPQLHIHHVARFKEDRAWPGPIWGAYPSVPYESEALAQRLSWLQGHLQGEGFQQP